MEIEYDGEYLTMRGAGTHRQIRLDQDQMIDICAAFARWNRKKQEAREEQLRAEGQIWNAIYLRHNREEQSEFFSLEAAVEFLLVGADMGGLAFSRVGRIHCPNGKIITGMELIELVNRLERLRGEES